MAKDDIILGAGEVYVMEFTGNTVPAHAEIEKDANNVGHCSGGFSVSYKPDVYDVKNQYGKIVKRFVRGEEITSKTGVLSWDLSKLEMLSCAKFEEDSEANKRTLTFGGSGNKLKTLLLRFVHTKEDGKKLRFTQIGQAGNGFSLDFGDKETVIDAEITAIEKVDNFLAEIEEEI